MSEITAARLADAARTLAHAGQWPRALELLAAASPGGEAERAVLAVAAAEVSVDHDFWCGTEGAAARLARAAEAVAAEAATSAEHGTLRWDLDLIRLRRDYYTELIGPDGLRFGPAGRDARVTEDLAARAARLRQAAPDGGRAASAMFLAGLVADNLRADPPTAQALFTEALAAAERAGDAMTESEALRHLGYWASQRGDTATARQQWERSAELRQEAGAVPYVLAQYLLLAELARDAGQEARARTLAETAGRWAHVLAIGLLEKQAAALTD
jgi:hypothetical protein